ncbi:MAG: phage tail protein [Xanthomonadales bacterium]|nr:phage tail protein [Xanthomonadales bacterium]
MGQPYIGEIRMFGGNFAPAGWAFCNGQLLSVSENETLFNLIGTTYGGDGVNTFALPDLRGRLAMHAGNGPGLTMRPLAQRGGAEAVTLTNTQLPSHDHGPMRFSSGAGQSNEPTGQVPGNSPSVDLWIEDTQSTSLDPSTVTSAGGSQPHDNLMPFLCVSFIISLFGIFPSPS